MCQIHLNPQNLSVDEGQHNPDINKISIEEFLDRLVFLRNEIDNLRNSLSVSDLEFPDGFVFNHLDFTFWSISSQISSILSSYHIHSLYCSLKGGCDD